MKPTHALCLLLLLILSACAPRPASAWDAATLRALDPADAADPAADLTALYTRQRGLWAEIRLDLLDIPFDPARRDADQPPLPDIYIALDTQPGGARTWLYPLSAAAHLQTSDLAYDLLIAIPASGQPIIYSADETDKLRRAWLRFPFTHIDRTADTLTLRFLSLGLPASYQAQALTLGGAPLDATPIIHTSQTEQAQAPLLLLFYDVFPAATPAQALRRWDGAHTGPYGERHGLRHLLEAADRYNLPLTLLHLAQPERLSALDYVGGKRLLDDLLRQNLVSLPNALPPAAWPAPDESDSLQPTAQGLTLEARRALLDAAINAQPLVWGGELAYSGWGNADAAAPAMAYLAARPYVRVLPAADFLTLPGAAQREPLSMPPGLAAPQEAALLAAMPAQSPLTAAAEGMLAHLTSPTRDPLLRQLRAHYLPDLHYFAAAARWQQDPAPLADCQSLPSACLLASPSFFAVLRSDGARLAYLFMRDSQGVHQITGPTYQFESGLSDRTRWDLTQAQAADPAALGGAFVDSDSPWGPCTPKITGAQSITFTCDAPNRQKTFALQPDGIRVQYSIPAPITHIGLTLDPWRRFEPNWGSLYGWSGAGGWEVQGGPSVRIQAAGEISRAAFLDSRIYMGAVEDPNAEYPPGHFLPFPMAVWHIASSTDILLQVVPSK